LLRKESLLLEGTFKKKTQEILRSRGGGLLLKKPDKKICGRRELLDEKGKKTNCKPKKKMEGGAFPTN